jgi:hypothetical protein
MKFLRRRTVNDVHDYTKPSRGHGHDYTFEPDKGGLEATMIGWGYGIREGHRILMSAPDDSNTTCYRVTSIKYFRDPKDMWSARVEFSPRSPEEADKHNRLLNEKYGQHLFAVLEQGLKNG